jgi:hypothetical protein
MNTNASLEDHGGKSHRESGIVGGIVQGILSFAAAVVGGSCAVLSLGVHTRLSGYAWKASRYWMGNSGWNRQIVDPFVALLMGAIVFARLSELLVGLVARLFGRRIILGRPYWWDLLIVGVPLLIWCYLAYVANFD